MNVNVQYRSRTYYIFVGCCVAVCRAMCECFGVSTGGNVELLLRVWNAWLGVFHYNLMYAGINATRRDVP